MKTQNQASQLNQNELDYLYNLGVTKFETGNYTQAINLFQFALGVKPDNLLYVKALAGALQAKREHLHAFCYYQYAYLHNMQNNLDCLFYSGICLYELGELDAARKYLNQFLSEMPDGSGLINQARLYLKLIISKLVQAS